MFDVESDRKPTSGLPVTGGQSGIWLAQQIEPDSSAYNIVFALHVRGAVDLDRLAAAVRGAVEEAECLHVQVVPGPDGPRQSPHPRPVDITVVDLRDAADPDDDAAAWIAADRERPVDLARAPLFGHALLRLADDRVVWSQRYHHILVDGMGVALITRRAGELYTAGEGTAGSDGTGTRTAETAATAPRDWSLSRLVAADHAYRASERHTADRAWWLERMAGRTEPVRLVDRAQTPMTRRLRRTTDLAPATVERLDTAARASGVRPSRVLLAAVAAYLHRVSGEQDLVLGLPVTARDDEVSAGVPGMVSNIVPLRLDVRPGTTGAALVAQVRDTVAGALAHGRYRAEDLARELGLVDGVPELVGPTVNILPRSEDLNFAGHEAELRPEWLGPVSDLAFSFAEGPGGRGHTVHLDADAAICDADTLAAHERRFLALLDAFTEDPDRPVGRIELTSAPERARLLDEFGTAPREVPELSWPAAFERQVRRSPQAVALVCEDRELTYTELDEAADRLAQLLRTRGVGAEDVVGVALPRSPELVVALLAVMKAGAAYLPLDADHPRDRIAYMLTDAGARTVVTVHALAGELPETAGVGRIELNSAPERARLLDEFGTAPREVPELSWPAAFERQVRRS
uniref:condensation domain-containing protein n=1 Tax=Streptomyces venezuelae TaxID=54571 RepID=UPI001F46761D